MSKCKHWDDQTLTYEKEGKLHSRGLRQTQCPVCNRWFWPHEWAKKPIPKKPKMVRVKAWADVSKEGILFGAFPDKFVFRAEKGGYTACTILIGAKYLKGGK